MDQKVIKQTIELLKIGDTVSIPILVTALSLPDHEPLYRKIVDALISFIDKNPDRKEFVKIIIDSSTLDKSRDIVKELIDKLTN